MILSIDDLSRQKYPIDASCLLLVVFVNYIHDVCMRRATVLTGHDAVIDEVNRWVRYHRSNCKRITIPRHENIYIYINRVFRIERGSLVQVNILWRQREKKEDTNFATYHFSSTWYIIYSSIEFGRICEIRKILKFNAFCFSSRVLFFFFFLNSIY